jgi:hypothetical protein
MERRAGINETETGSRLFQMVNDKLINCNQENQENMRKHKLPKVE